MATAVAVEVAVEADVRIVTEAGQSHVRRAIEKRRLFLLGQMNTAMNTEKKPQDFESVLSGQAFAGLKALFSSLTSDRQALQVAVNETNSYEELLARLGYRMVVTKQIHVQDAYSRVGRAGGIKTVLPYNDIPTQSSMPTLVNFDSTVTVTPRSADFFNKMLTELKSALRAAQG